MTDRTMTAMYDTRGAAETARDELVSAGIARDAISIRGTEAGEAGAAATTAGEGRGFWGSLSDLFMPDEDRSTYEEGIRRGGYLLSVRAPQGLEDEAEAILERSEPIDVDARSASWRESGWTGHGGAAAAGGTAATGAVPVGTPYLAEEDRTDLEATRTAPTLAETGSGAPAARSTAEGEDTLKVMEEQVRVGKREVGRGGVRVRSYVTERPVEEQVELRQEHVTVERRPVDRELAPGEATAAFQERTIEAVERGEEAVVSKTARVVEEIGIRKDVERQTETVRDTVRKQEVEIDDERGGTSPAAGAAPSSARTATDVDATRRTGGGTTLDPDLDPTTR